VGIFPQTHTRGIAVMKDKLNEMKAKKYESLAAVNRSFEQLISALYKLEKRVNLGEDYAHDQEIIFKDIWARINTRALARITEFELEDENDYGKMRAKIERRMRGRPVNSHDSGNSHPQA
jgi:hypothetical protein